MHEDLIGSLRATPQRLRRLLRGKPPEALSRGRRPEFGAADAGQMWSPVEVVLHVRASNMIVAPRVYQILVRDNPPLPAFDERALGDLLAKADLPLEAQLTAFQIERAELTAVLQSLDAPQWERSGDHEIHRDQTVLSVCESIVAHEGEHIAQLEQLVGPES